MKLNKLICLLLALVLCVGLLAGCGGGSGSKEPESESEAAPETQPEAEEPEAEPEAEEPEAEEPEAAAGSVYWLNFKPESDEVLQQIATMYTDKTGVPVKVVTAASGTYSQTLNAEMDKSEPPTLFVIGNTAGVRDWQDYALDLTDTPIANELNNTAANLYSPDGKLVSIPYSMECYGIIVNPDLVEAAGHSMDEITNFDGLKTVAEDIHARAAELGFDAFTSNDMDSSSNWRYVGHMANLEYYYEEQDSGTTWAECPASLTGAYMDNFRNLYDLCVNNSTVDRTELATGGHDAQNEFITGKAAFYVEGSWKWSAVSEAVPNATMIPYYCGVEGEEKAGLNCGTENCWAINCKASEENQKATMDFMVWCVTDPEASALLVESFSAMPYKQCPASTNGFLTAADAYVADGCYSMDWATNFQPNVDEYRATLTSAMNQYNADPTDANWDTVVTAFVDGWATQYAAVNG